MIFFLLVALSKASEEHCGICLQELRHGESMGTINACDHSFHEECISRWLKRSKTCPTCRAQVEISPNLQWSRRIVSYTSYNDHEEWYMNKVKRIAILLISAIPPATFLNIAPYTPLFDITMIVIFGLIASAMYNILVVLMFLILNQATIFRIKILNKFFTHETVHSWTYDGEDSNFLLPYQYETDD